MPSCHALDSRCSRLGATRQDQWRAESFSPLAASFKTAQLRAIMVPKQILTVDSGYESYLQLALLETENSIFLKKA